MNEQQKEIIANIDKIAERMKAQNEIVRRHIDEFNHSISQIMITSKSLSERLDVQLKKFGEIEEHEPNMEVYFPSDLIGREDLLFKPYLVTKGDISKIVIPFYVEQLSKSQEVKMRYFAPIGREATEDENNYIVCEDYLALRHAYGFRYLPTNEFVSVNLEILRLIDEGKTKLSFTEHGLKQIWKDAEKLKEKFSQGAKS